MKIQASQLPANFVSKMFEYYMARLKHKLTEGVPAPFPEFEILRTCADCIESGEPLEIEDDSPPNAAALVQVLNNRVAQLESDKIALQTQIDTLTGARNPSILDFIA